jgi:hypothetical protein
MRRSTPDMKGVLPLVLLERAGLARLRGDADAIARDLAEARRLFAEMGATGWDDYARSIEARAMVVPSVVEIVPLDDSRVPGRAAGLTEPIEELADVQRGLCSENLPADSEQVRIRSVIQSYTRWRVPWAARATSSRSPI